MNETTSTFLFRIWPYLALTLAAAGAVVRLAATGDRIPAVTRAALRARHVFVGGRRWIALWALLASAHVGGLLFPRAVLALTRTPWRLFALEAAGFTIGLGVLAACVRSAWMHLRRPAQGGWSLVADFGDSLFLSFLVIAVGSGLLAASLHRWGSEWAAVTVAPYAASLVQGRPIPAFVAHLPLLVRLHLFAAFAAVACFPASRLALWPLSGAHRALTATGGLLAGAAKPARAWIRRGAGAWLWPEREVRWIAKPREDGGVRKPVGKVPAWSQQAREVAAAAKQPAGKAV